MIEEVIKLEKLIKEYEKFTEIDKELYYINVKIKLQNKLFIINTLCFGVLFSAAVTLFLQILETNNIPIIIISLLCIIADAALLINLNNYFTKHIYVIDYVIKHKYGNKNI